MTGRGVQTTRVRSFDFMPNFHDLSDGSSIVNYAGHDFGPLEDIIYDAPTPAPPQPPPQTATQVNEAQRAAQINPAWRAAPYPPEPFVQPERRPRARRVRRGFSDPDAAIRKDPNAWSLREAVELCKLLEVVLPEAGFHIALTGGLLYKEGRRKDCDLMFYQIRQVDPNYEVLWKYLQVAGVIRSPSYPENGWLVKATYRGKAVDCLFPNAKKVKKVVGKETGGYDFRPPPPEAPTIAEAPACVQEEAFRSPTPREQALLRNAGIITAPAPIVYRPGTLVRHINGVPEVAAPYTAAELLATPAPAPVPAVEQWEEIF